MKKLLAFGLMFCSGILFSPATAIHGIDKGSNCQFQLPYTMEELTGMGNRISLGQENNFRINTVNRCTNRSERLQLAAIAEDTATVRLDGFWADEKGAPVWRQITIDKADFAREGIHQAALMRKPSLNKPISPAEPLFTAHIVNLARELSF